MAIVLYLCIQFVNGRMSPDAVSTMSGPGADGHRVTQLRAEIRVGQLPNSVQALTSKQILRAPGQRLQFGGRPVDLAHSPEGRTVFIKNVTSLLVANALSWSLIQMLPCPTGGAVEGHLIEVTHSSFACCRGGGRADLGCPARDEVDGLREGAQGLAIPITRPAVRTPAGAKTAAGLASQRMAVTVTRWRGRRRSGSRWCCSGPGPATSSGTWWRS